MSLSSKEIVLNQFKAFYQHIATSKLYHWLDVLPKQLSDWLNETHPTSSQSNQYKWYKTLEHLPIVENTELILSDTVKVTAPETLSEGEIKGLTFQLKNLMPWRKGPYDLLGVYVDTEWRSDHKWNRVINYISPLKDRWVLDVGCGSGYHMWRMLGQGAHTVIGIDPTELFLCQFLAVKQIVNQTQNAFFLPLGIEELPELKAFDTVFSMGVLYHRRSPLDHLIQLKNQLRSGGELVLETLIIEGGVNEVLVPEDRYAQMNNVYFIPSAEALINWLQKVGFTHIRMVDKTTTNFSEQRRTQWMQNESLEDFLDATDPALTIEGYPAPLRAVFIANKP